MCGMNKLIMMELIEWLNLGGKGRRTNPVRTEKPGYERMPGQCGDGGQR